MGQDRTKFQSVNALLDYLKGESAQFDRLFGGMAVVASDPITTNTTTVLPAGARGFIGLVCTAVGTAWTARVWDNTSAAGKIIVPQIAVALGEFTSLYNPGGKVILCGVGIAVETAGTAPGSLYALYLP